MTADKNNIQNKIHCCIYEQPLSERIRLFLRLESMFTQIHLFHSANEYYSIQLFLDALFDVLDFFHRYEIRAEILKELQRLQNGIARNNTLSKMNIDNTDILNALAIKLNAIHAMNLNPISELRTNELLNSLRQRNFNQSGNCLFEVPAYQFWLSQNINRTNEFLLYCYTLFLPISDAISLILQMIRVSSDTKDEYTSDGMFLKSLQRDKRNQMIRIHLTPNDDVFPRISGDNHRIAIRFMEQNNPQLRAQQTKKPVHFRLQICML